MMIQEELLRANLTELRRLRDKLGNDPIHGPQIRGRIQMALAELNQLTAPAAQTVEEDPASHYTALRKDSIITTAGVFRGVLLETRTFNFIADENKELIIGRVSENLTEGDLERLHQLTNQHGEARLMIVDNPEAEGNDAQVYILLDGHGDHETNR